VLAVLGDAAHARARAEFSRERMVDRYEALFTALLTGEQPAPAVELREAA
jgi:hypothetical protein